MTSILRKNSRPYQILKYLGLGSGILLIGILSPLAGTQLIRAGIKSYFRKRRFEKEKFLRDIKSLQKRNLVFCKGIKDGKMEIKLTTQGKTKILQYQADSIKLSPLPRWDKKWRLILFDIPDSSKSARDTFRRKLHNMEFYAIQKSVFITPYPCDDEIDFLASILNIRKYVLIFYVSGFEGEDKLKYHFNLL